MNIFILLVVIAVVYVVINYILDIMSKEEKVEAKLIRKTHETYLGPEDIPMERYTLCFMVLNKKKCFDVSYDNYQKYDEDDEGVLVCKRNKFVRFDRKDK